MRIRRHGRRGGCLARHLGAFGVALSIGLLYVAWRPHRAYGMLPFAVYRVIQALVIVLAFGVFTQ